MNNCYQRLTMWMNWKLSTWANASHPIETLVVRVRLAACALILTLYIHSPASSYYCVVFIPPTCDAATPAEKNAAAIYREGIHRNMCVQMKQNSSVRHFTHSRQTIRLLCIHFPQFIAFSRLLCWFSNGFSIYVQQEEKTMQFARRVMKKKTCRLTKTGFYSYLGVKYNCGCASDCRHTVALHSVKHQEKTVRKILKMWRTFPWYFSFFSSNKKNIVPRCLTEEETHITTLTLSTLN